jgi:hypothetical protein
MKGTSNRYKDSRTRFKIASQQRGKAGMLGGRRSAAKDKGKKFGR